MEALGTQQGLGSQWCNRLPAMPPRHRGERGYAWSVYAFWLLHESWLLKPWPKGYRGKDKRYEHYFAPHYSNGMHAGWRPRADHCASGSQGRLGGSVPGARWWSHADLGGRRTRRTG